MLEHADWIEGPIAAWMGVHPIQARVAGDAVSATAPLTSKPAFRQLGLTDERPAHGNKVYVTPAQNPLQAFDVTVAANEKCLAPD